MTSPSQRLDYINNHSNCQQVASQFQTSGNHGFRKSETVLSPVNSFLTEIRVA